MRAKHIRWARLGLVLEFESSTRTGERRGMTSGDHQSVRVREGERREGRGLSREASLGRKKRRERVGLRKVKGEEENVFFNSTINLKPVQI